MKISLLVLSHSPANWAQQACRHYENLLPRYWHYSTKIIKPLSHSGSAERLAAEANVLRNEIKLITAPCYTICLEEDGELITSQTLADWCTQWQNQAVNPVFVIGSADGLDKTFSKSCNKQLSLSRFTLPHALARVVLTEQLYRASTILQNHPYHRV